MRLYEERVFVAVQRNCGIEVFEPVDFVGYLELRGRGSHYPGGDVGLSWHGRNVGLTG